MAFFNKVQTIKMDYMQLTNVFDRLLLVPEYVSLWDDLLKNLNKHYFGSITNTPDGRYTFYMSVTNVYLFPYVKKYIWIRDNIQKVAYELDRPGQYKKFKKSAVNAIVNKKINVQMNGTQNPNQNMQMMNGVQSPNQNI